MAQCRRRGEKGGLETIGGRKDGDTLRYDRYDRSRKKKAKGIIGEYMGQEEKGER